MHQNSYLSVEPRNDYQFSEDTLSSPADDSFLEDLVHQKATIQRTKLEVLTAEILVRLNILSRHLRSVDDDKAKVAVMLERIDRLANYHFREHREKSVLYQQLFDLGQQRRQAEVECWRDVVMVMRDFLMIWETHQQAQARAIFLEHAGT